MARYRDLAAKGRISTDELAEAEAHLKREMDDATAAAKRAGNNSGAFRSSIFGLEPYQLQNLSYQVNDVFTQLASGTSLTRTLGQQGGQILQIFPRISSAIFGAFTNPAFLGAAAVVATIAIALNRAADQAERLRNATADLGRRTNGADYKAPDVAEQQRQLQRLGASAGDARSALGTFIDAGVPAQSLARFGRVAKELAGTLGTELPDAAKQVATAFTSGYEAIAELDNRLNFLTGTQRDHIRQLFEEGRAREAQTAALNIFTGKMDGAATQARGPWASANRELKKSWDDLLESFANSKPIQETSGLDELQEQKALLQQQAEFLRSIGDNDGAEKIESQIRSIGGAIGQAYDALIAFYQALTPQQRIDLGILDQAQLDALIAKLGQAKDASQEWGRVAGLPGQEIARAFAGAAVNAFTNFINKVAAGKNVFKSLADGIREFAASFIQSIAQMILQLLAYAAAVSILRALGVPVPGTIGVGQNHTGGIAGGSAGGVRRNVSPAIFAGAMRYHTGGIVGLAADEQPAILRKGEEVLTESDPRHRFNAGTAANDRAATPAPVNIINTFDKEEAAEMLLRTRAGERAFINYISDNKSAVRAALG